MSHASHDVIHQPEIVNVATCIISSWYMNLKSINQEISGCPNWRYPQTHKFKFHCSNSWKLPFWFVGKLNPSTASAPRWRRETGWPFPTTTTHQGFFPNRFRKGVVPYIYIYAWLGIWIRGCSRQLFHVTSLLKRISLQEWETPATWFVNIYKNSI